MLFRVLPNSASHPSSGKSIAYLWTDNWNDYWDYCTLYVLTYFDGSGVQHELGGVKIGQFNWQKDQRRPAIPDQFGQLDAAFFSLGQGEDFYSGIFKLGETGLEILRGLNDLVINPELYARAKEEDVTQTSLMRSVSNSNITDHFPSLLAGAARLTSYQFRYLGPSKIGKNEIKNVTLEFDVTPELSPPTNIHVIIGRNGVGKSYLLNSMVRSLVLEDKDTELDGSFLTTPDFFEALPSIPFVNIVSVSFSAFDEFNLVPDVAQGESNIAYSYVGLRELVGSRDGRATTIVRGPKELASKFSASASICRGGQKRNRWRRALMALQSDPLFAEANVVGLVDFTDEADAFTQSAEGLYRQKLSSGHKIVLLTITKLVETVEEKTLVLMDEPEAHLHPPLLSAFVRALSELLVNRNGVAIVATHSPVVLQEVPSSCVWKITRFGSVSQADRVPIETFAENVGVLTREVFGLEVEETGFHKLLSDAAASGESIEGVTAKFGGAVGAEGRALIGGIIANRGRDIEFDGP